MRSLAGIQSSDRAVRQTGLRESRRENMVEIGIGNRLKRREDIQSVVFSYSGQGMRDY